MNVTTRFFSVLMLLSISLAGCNADQASEASEQKPEAVAEETQTKRAGAAGSIHIDSEDQFNQLVKQGDVVVDFFATWCGPCKILGPIIDEVASEVTSVTFLKVDIDKFRGLASQ